MKRRLAIMAAATALAACESEPPDGAGSPTAEARPQEQTPPEPGLREVFPHVRVDRAAGLVEFDGVVPIDAHDPHTPIVYLEVMVCIPDTKEHETLLMTHAKPSHVQAAMLLIGLEPGSPGRWFVDGQGRVQSVPPTGDPVRVTFVYEDNGEAVEVCPTRWVTDLDTGRPLTIEGGGPLFVFAGSRFVEYGGEEFYDADWAGTLIGLTTFGGEVIAWREVLSHDSAVQEPAWIADNTRVPEQWTPVAVRIRKWSD
jgi:hypothetical protein